MNTQQYAKYFTDAYHTFFNNLEGEKYRHIELLGDSAAQIATNQMQVELQREESEKAYRRSSAPNQVAQMMSAGMSRAGAINALNGGGSYTPAPISLGSPTIGSGVSNVRQNDLATLSSVQDAVNTMVANWQQHQQMKMQQKQFDATLAEEKRQFNITHAETKRMNDVNINNLVEQGKVLQAQAKKLGFETNILETNQEILNLTKQDYIDSENAENLARKVRAENEKYIEEVRAKGLQHLSPKDLQQLIQNLTERQMVQTTLEMFGVYLREKGHDAAKKFLQESLEQALLKGSPLTSAIL